MPLSLSVLLSIFSFFFTSSFFTSHNGLYEYFYQMKYGEKFTAEKEVVGIPAEEFENVIYYVYKVIDIAYIHRLSRNIFINLNQS